MFLQFFPSFFPYKLRSGELVLRIDVKKLVPVAERQMEIQIARFCFLWLLKISFASENVYRRVL